MKIQLIVLIALTLTSCAKELRFDTLPESPINVRPLNATNIVANADTQFVWRAEPLATYYEFHIFNRENNDIDQYYRRNLRATDICNETECSITLSVALPYIVEHAWRVRAGNNVGLSEWNRTLFNMVHSGVGPSLTGAPVAPTPSTPEDNTVLSNSMVEFVWSSIQSAESYDFHLYNAADGNMTSEVLNMPATVVCQPGDDCRLRLQVALPPANNHAWRVRASNEFGQSQWTRSVFEIRDSAQ